MIVHHLEDFDDPVDSLARTSSIDSFHETTDDPMIDKTTFDCFGLRRHEEASSDCALCFDTGFCSTSWS